MHEDWGGGSSRVGKIERPRRPAVQMAEPVVKKAIGMVTLESKSSRHPYHEGMCRAQSLVTMTGRRGG